ncbi:MAG: hypothetical protein ACKOAU_18820 [Pirellula sp.]
MIDIKSIADLELLRESVDLECKLAALDQSGQPQITRLFLETNGVKAE